MPRRPGASFARGTVVRIIGVDALNDAFKSIDAGEVDFRYVVDMASLHGKGEDDSSLAKLGL